MDKQHFFELSEFITNRLTPEESLSLNLSAEESRFCRFNRGKVRQDGMVADAFLHVSLTNPAENELKSLSASTSLSKNFDQNCQRVTTLLERLRNDLAKIPPDPYARIPHFNHKSDYMGEGELIPGQEVTDQDTLHTR